MEGVLEAFGERWEKRLERLAVRLPVDDSGVVGWAGRWRSGLPAAWFGGRGQGLRGRAAVPSVVL